MADLKIAKPSTPSSPGAKPSTPRSPGVANFAPLSEQDRKDLSGSRASGIVDQLALLITKHHSKVSDLFKAIDVNADGIVNKKELTAALQGFGVRAGDREMNQLFEKLDPDESGGITFRELQSAIMDAMHGADRPKASPPPTDRGRSADRAGAFSGNPSNDGRPSTTPGSMRSAAPAPAPTRPAVGLTRRNRYSRLSQEERFEELCAEGRLLDAGSKATLDKCLESVRREAIDAKVGLTPLQLLQRASGQDGFSRPSTPRKSTTVPVDERTEQTNREAAEQAMMTLRCVAQDANEKLLSLFCRQLFYSAIAREKDYESGASSVPPTPRPTTAPAAMHGAGRPVQWWPQRWWMPPPQVSPRPAGPAPAYTAPMSPRAARSPMPSPRGMVWVG